MTGHTRGWGKAAMTFEEVVDQALAMLQRRGRVTYRMLQRHFQLDDAALEDLKEELIYGQRVGVDEDARVLVWMGEHSAPTPSASVRVPAPDDSQARAPLSYTPPHLVDKILTSRSALEGERKQVTVLFADLKGSMELLADRDPEAARQLLDPVLEHMMAAVHRYEGTVNQVMGDGIMALFGAPIAHEDHAVRACYAALRMQEAVKQYAEEIFHREGLRVQIRVGLNSGEVVVRSIGSDLRMDYTAVGQTTHLAARMEQTALPGTILLAPDTLRLAEGYVQVPALGPVPIKGLAAPVEVYEVVGAGLAPATGRLSPWWASRAWASRAWCGNSITPTARRAGWCWRAAPSPTARPPRICRSLTCSRATAASSPATSRDVCARSCSVSSWRSTARWSRPCPPSWRCWTCRRRTRPGRRSTRPSGAAAPSRPVSACCCARARSSPCCWCARICTGSRPRPRPCSIAWWRACPPPACCSW